jgi:phosphoribosyl-dephospho-CoA transferase
MNRCIALDRDMNDKASCGFGAKDAGSGSQRQRLHRHDIVHVHAPACERSTTGIADAAARLRVAKWIEAGHPFVARQQVRSAVNDDDSVALGLPLPPGEGKRRIALTLPWRIVDRVASPPALIDVIATAPARWRSALSLLRLRSESIGIRFRVFGSAAWQMLTGLAYVDDASDIDLLWRPSSRLQLAGGVAVLTGWEHATGIRADGEIIFGDDDAVAWREWSRRAHHPRVLVKRLDGPVLRTPGELLRMLDRECAGDGA